MTGVIGYIFLYRGLGNGNVSVVAPTTASWDSHNCPASSFFFAEALPPLQIVGSSRFSLGFLFFNKLSRTQKSIKMSGWLAGAADALIAMA